MPNYRRPRIAGGTYFFTLVVHARRNLFNEPSARRLLGDAFRRCRREWPFTIEAIVLLPDHLHAIWSLPSGDSEYSARWGWIKKEFSKAYLEAGGTEIDISPGREEEGRFGVWQPRFWDHVLESDDDFERHFDYVHYNPVKHGLVSRPRDWRWSSFHRWVKRGVYDVNWAAGLSASPPHIDAMFETTGEPGTNKETHATLQRPPEK